MSNLKLFEGINVRSSGAQRPRVRVPIAIIAGTRVDPSTPIPQAVSEIVNEILSVEEDFSELVTQSAANVLQLKTEDQKTLTDTGFVFNEVGEIIRTKVVPEFTYDIRGLATKIDPTKKLLIVGVREYSADARSRPYDPEQPFYVIDGETLKYYPRGIYQGNILAIDVAESLEDRETRTRRNSPNDDMFFGGQGGDPDDDDDDLIEGTEVDPDDEDALTPGQRANLRRRQVVQGDRHRSPKETVNVSMTISTTDSQEVIENMQQFQGVDPICQLAISTGVLRGAGEDVNLQQLIGLTADIYDSEGNLVSGGRATIRGDDGHSPYIGRIDERGNVQVEFNPLSNVRDINKLVYDHYNVPSHGAYVPDIISAVDLMRAGATVEISVNPDTLRQGDRNDLPRSEASHRVLLTTFELNADDLLKSTVYFNDPNSQNPNNKVTLRQLIRAGARNGGFYLRATGIEEIPEDVAERINNNANVQTTIRRAVVSNRQLSESEKRDLLARTYIQPILQSWLTNPNIRDDFGKAAELAMTEAAKALEAALARYGFTIADLDPSIDEAALQELIEHGTIDGAEPIPPEMDDNAPPTDIPYQQE